MTIQTDDIARRVRRQFGDESGVQVQDADIIDWINDSIREITLQQDDLNLTTGYIQAVAGQHEYYLPSDCFTISTVSYLSDSTYYDLRVVNSRQMSEYFNGWDGEETATPVFFARGENKGTLLLWPKPEATLNEAIKIVYTATNDLIESLDDVVELPDYYFSTILEYCLMKAYEMDEDWPAADRKAAYVQSTLDANNGRESWFGRQSYPSVQPTPEDYL